jgi:hypothetical protein
LVSNAYILESGVINLSFGIATLSMAICVLVQTMNDSVLINSLTLVQVLFRLLQLCNVLHITSRWPYPRDQ